MVTTYAGTVARLCEPILEEAPDVCDRITEQTILRVSQRERKTRGVVGSVLVFFRQGFDQNEREYLLGAELNQANREERYEIAWRATESAQAEVRDWLSRSGQVRDCFRDRTLFDFVPPRDIRTFPVLNAMSIPATTRLIELLKSKENVLAIQDNFRIEPMPEQDRLGLDQVELLAKAAPAAAHRDGYTWGWHHLGLSEIHKSGCRGAGVRVGIANTGVTDRASDLVYKIKDFAKVQPPDTVQPCHAFDTHWHGTHAAGVIAGACNSHVQIGGAPDAEIKAVSVIDGSHGWASTLLAGLEWLADPFRAVSIVNLSVGIRRPGQDVRLLLEDMIQRLAGMGILCVAAIGNERDTAMFPGALDNVIGCGALGPDGSVWADSGTKPDLVAPGVSVFSCLPPCHPDLPGENYGWCTGTSCAAAHVSALAALLIQSRPIAGVPLLFDALLSASSHAQSPDDRFGHGVPSFWKAIDHIDQSIHAA